MDARSGGEGGAAGGAELFTQPATYKAILAVRHAVMDLVATAVFAVAVIVWEVAVNDASPTKVQVLKSTGWVSWWTNDAMIPATPAVIAAAVFLMGLRIGTRMVDHEVLRGLIVGYGGQLVLYALVFLVAVGAVGRIPGSFVARYVPLAGAVYIALRVRGRRSRGPGGRLRRPTSTGFQPSHYATVLVGGRVWLDSVNKAYPTGMAATTNIAETTMHEAASYFLRRRDPRTAAYCIARGIDYLLMHALLADAEKVIRDAGEDPRIARQPAVHAARAQLLRAVGRRVEGHSELLLAARGARRRASVALQALIIESAIDISNAAHGPGVVPGALPWSTRERFVAVCHRQVKPVVLSLIIEARSLAGQQPKRAVELAYQAAGLPELLLAELREDDATYGFEELIAVRGLAFELAGRIAMDGRDYSEAATAYMDAYTELNEGIILGRRHLARAARCLTFAFVARIRAGYDTPDQENHALDAIRAGLEILERGRGLLREEDDRAQYIAELAEVIDTVFDVLTESVGYQHRKAGELGAWLLESLHRTLTADLLAAESPITSPDIDGRLAQLQAEEARIRLSTVDGPQLADDARTRLAALAAMIDELVASRLRSTAPDPALIDMQQLCELLGGRVAVIYRSVRTAEGRWRINAALITPTREMRVHTTLLPAPGADPEIALWREPGGVLDILNTGEPQAVEDIYYNPLSDQVWRDLSCALVPEAWWDVICPQDPAGIEIVVVPDGPLSSLPISALPMRDSRLLLEYATVSFAPSLGMLRPANTATAALHTQSPMTVVTHVDEEELTATSAELAQWRAQPASLVRLIETHTRSELEEKLAPGSEVDVVSISVHGAPEGGFGADRQFGRFVRLRDQTILSTRAALGLTWPPTVLLGACWIGGVDLAVGREPTGFPIACIQQGADCVLGGTAPIPDTGSAGLLADVITRLPHTALARALREAQLALGRGTPLAELPPAYVAGLTCWAVTPAGTTSPAPPDQMQPVHWNADGTAISERSTTGVFDPAGLSHALQRVLAHAHQRDPRHSVTTLGLLQSSFDIDDEPWDSFLLAAELTAPLPPASIDESATGTVTTRAAGMDLSMTVPLANALHRADAVRDALHDETILPAHAVYAALLEPESGAHAWITGQASPEAKRWPQHLSDRIFRTDLPTPQSLQQHNLDVPTRHERRAAASRLSDTAARRMVSGRAWDNKFTALALVVVLGFAPDSLFLLYSLQTYLHGRGQLGVVLASNPGGGAIVEAVLPGASAAQAGLLPGDVVRAIDSTQIRTASDAVDAIDGYVRGAIVHMTVGRSGRTVHVTAELEPLPTNPTPGTLGITVEDGQHAVVVTQVGQGSSAQAAGLEAGDEIAAIDGIPVYGSAATALYLIHYHNPGTKITLTVYRQGRSLELDAVLGG